MDPLDLSVIGYPGQFDVLARILARADIACRLHEMVWEDGWERLARIALARSGPDVSQVGMTWLDSLLSTDAVRPFTDDEIAAMGGPSVFFPALWQTVSPPLWESRVWAIPWQADARIVLYWRDMLEQAGIAEETAFQTPAQVEETMERLRDSGIAAPWGIWAARVNLIMHNAASWIWGNGGDIISADGTEVLFDQPKSLDGLLAYFRLHRYMPPGLDRLAPDTQVIDLFTARQVAVVMGPCQWFGQMMSALEQSPDLAARIGVALPPGPAFVGGSHLIVWKHTRRAQEAVALIRFLVGKQVQSECCHAVGFLPVRPDVLSEPPYTIDARYQKTIEALQTGRSFPVISRWGEVEDRLRHSLVWLWDTLMAEPDQDVEALVRPYIESVTARLAVTLGAQR